MKMKVALGLLTLVWTWFCAAQAPLPAPNSNNSIHFAIIGDLTGGERQGVFARAANHIHSLQPDFVMSVGDMIEGGTEDILVMNQEWNAFQSAVNSMGVPFYPAVGNHDISNSLMRNWYEETVGPRYYYFRHKNLLFLVLDSEDFSDDFFSEVKIQRNEAVALYKKGDKAGFANSLYAKLPERKFGAMRQQQIEDVLRILSEQKDVDWTFVFMHKPMHLSGTSGFNRIEEALSERPYTVFSGHQHSYFHEVRRGNDYIQMGTTGGAFTPVDRGVYTDHIMWVSVVDGKPRFTNLALDGLTDVAGPSENED